jgi:uncharacterized protein YgiM (DUF1202 family)
VSSAGDGFLNQRTGADTREEILVSVSNGPQVEVLGAHGRWLQVRRKSGAIGWARRRYLVD